MNRGARHASTFHDDEDRHTFCRLLQTAVQLSDVEIHGYVLMGNHFHLLAHTPSGGLGPFMQFVGQHYTQRFNRRHGFDGALFRGRYKAKLIESDQYLMTTSRYIHRNPIEAAATSDPVLYPWSSLGAYIGTTGRPPWLSTGFILDLAGGRDGYLELMREPDLEAA